MFETEVCRKGSLRPKAGQPAFDLGTLEVESVGQDNLPSFNRTARAGQPALTLHVSGLVGPGQPGPTAQPSMEASRAGQPALSFYY